MESARLDEPASVSGWTLTAQEADYFTPISDNVALVFVRRHLDCLYYGMNHQWVKAKINDIFKCL